MLMFHAHLQIERKLEPSVGVAETEETPARKPKRLLFGTSSETATAPQADVLAKRVILGDDAWFSSWAKESRSAIERAVGVWGTSNVLSAVEVAVSVARSSFAGSAARRRVSKLRTT